MECNIKYRGERYQYLIDKFFDGVPLEKRTQINNYFGMLESCMGECSSFFFGDHFCMASFGYDIQCPYLGDRVNGGNPFAKCKYLDEVRGVIDENSYIVPYFFRNPPKC